MRPLHLAFVVAVPLAGLWRARPDTPARVPAERQPPTALTREQWRLAPVTASPRSLAGGWSCSSYSPGPTVTSSGYLMIMHFTLAADGTYREGNATGRWTLDPGSGHIVFADGDLARLYTSTYVGSADGVQAIRTFIGKHGFSCTRDRRAG